jgi:hypothetical protein
LSRVVDSMKRAMSSTRVSGSENGGSQERGRSDSVGSAFNSLISNSNSQH